MKSSIRDNINIYLAYRTNLDGYYSVFNTFLFFRDIQKANISTRDFINYLSQFNSFEDINQTIYKFAHKVQPEVLTSAILGIGKKAKELKPKQENFLPSIAKDIIYVPIRFDPETETEFPYGDYDPENLRNSILLFTCNFPKSLEAVQKLSEGFHKVIIMDYYWMSEKYVNTIPQEEGYPRNIMHLFNPEKSGATLTLEFFEKLKGSPLFLDLQNQEKLLEMLSYIEDKFTKKYMLEDSENFISGLIATNTRADYNPTTNSKVFKLLFNVKIPDIIQIGTEYADKQAERARNLIDKKKCLIYLGGRESTGEGQLGQCYGVQTYFKSFSNELFDQLINISWEDGFQDVGIIFQRVRNEDMWNLHFRFYEKGELYWKFVKKFPKAALGLSAKLVLTSQNMKKWLPKHFPKNVIS